MNKQKILIKAMKNIVEKLESGEWIIEDLNAPNPITLGVSKIGMIDYIDTVSIMMRLKNKVVYPHA